MHFTAIVFNIPRETKTGKRAEREGMVCSRGTQAGIKPGPLQRTDWLSAWDAQGEL